ncbi:hypothetical protein [Mumia zhuanghuii]|uniref:Uncharacterized protein n=1 Tax=Mumia zhuanghuii TaxID=2585211 RepID=A0A5C4MTG4_9ACTN|nr:hypothetical protein [Mumia zhuanghuii]TNC47068.1 hypothetical protein FHE65_10620 [Mumia zhuanghuii]TNC50376.1 hypothetical protein FHE65_03685 [Mumia zhuanghuii]
MEASEVESGPGWTLWRTPGGTWVEVGDDLARVLPDGVDVAVVATAWPRGRWSFGFTGTAVPYEAPMTVRTDPLLTCAMTVLAAAKQARLRDGVRATFGEVQVEAPAVGIGASRVTAVLDVRAESARDRDAVLDAVRAQAQGRAERDRTRVEITAEVVQEAVPFDENAVRHLCGALDAPTLASPGADRAAALAVRGERAVALVVRHRDADVVAAALAALT